MPRSLKATLAMAALSLIAVEARADDILDALDAARGAYEEGHIGAALQELSIAEALLQQQKTEGLVAFLPDAPAGWTREIDTEMAAGLAMFGGGTGAEARYSSGSDSVSLMLLADSPMITSFAGMLSNPAILMASGGKLVKLGDQRFAQTDGEYTALIGNRILVQASGESEAAVMAILEAIDFDGLLAYTP